jgi:predicted MFS family arabinose efflux permease
VLALLTLFVAIESRTPQPLVRLGILRNGPLVRANIGMAVMAGAYIGFQFVGTLYLQTMHGWSPLETALAFLPGGLLVALGSPRIGPLVDRYGTARLIAVGMAAFVAAYALFLRLDGSPSYLGLMVPTMLLIGVGFALCFPAQNIQATAGVSDHEQGLASGLVNTSFQLGGAIGLAIVTAVVSGDISVDAFRPAIAVVTGIAALGLIVSVAGLIPAMRDRLAGAEA